MGGRRALGAAVAGGLLMAVSLTGVPPAAAHDGPMGCQGRESTHFSPGKTLLPRLVHATAHIDYLCTDASGSVRPATGRITGRTRTSCVDISGGRTREVITYADGGRSLILYTDDTVAQVANANLVTFRGRVLEGRGKGLRADRTLLLLDKGLPTACLTPEGLTAASGVASLRIGPG
ncbi:hypothetical protein ACH4PU_34540 [Streptomyces sp. NPDC021100]|uniref:hypothetical protein n=1 Tax=Streptomyces sp. NPDC021100 TaxID=3365114 RepID=UPI0037A442FD